MDEAIDIKPWDWRYYAEKVSIYYFFLLSYYRIVPEQERLFQVRQSNYNLDEADVKPYFPLERMVAAIFDCAGKLFGLSFRLRFRKAHEYSMNEFVSIDQLSSSSSSSSCCR